MPDDLCSVAGNCAINVVCHKCKKTTIGAWHAFCTSTLASKRVVKLQPTASLCVYISTYTHIHQFICIHRPTHIWRSNAFYMYVYIYMCVCRKANQYIYIYRNMYIIYIYIWILTCIHVKQTSWNRLTKFEILLLEISVSFAVVRPLGCEEVGVLANTLIHWNVQQMI